MDAIEKTAEIRKYGLKIYERLMLNVYENTDLLSTIQRAS